MYAISFFLVLTFFDKGESLECYVCHGRQNPECGDPFPLGNASGTIISYDCNHVRDVGVGAAAVASVLGGAFGQFSPLQPPPHICYKLSGQVIVRGCGKPNFCQNVTDFCDICDTDSCNNASKHQFLSILFLTLAVLTIYFK